MRSIIYVAMCQLMVLLLSAQEGHLSNIKKLTFGGDNAEAYFSPDGKFLTMQVTNTKIGASCDQIYMLDLSENNPATESLKLISTGKGRTTCSYFMPDGKHILYASTHHHGEACPPPAKPRKDGKYLWSVYPEFDIFIADLQGKITKQLTDSPGYDAEAVVSPDGKKIAFTSSRSGDLELWTMDIDGTNLKQITSGLGYDGGSFFSPDSKKLVFRASRPKTEKEIKEYTELLAEHLVAPTEMEIYTCNADGSDLKQITHLGKANWAPFFHPSGQKIIFSSNHHSTRGYDFQLYLIDLNGEHLKQITYESMFNAFPMFSPDGKKLVFSSNRQQGAPRETNVFIADWNDGDPVENADQKTIYKHIEYLASDKLQGRLTGSKGEKLASKYISKEYKKYGLLPYYKKSYLQPFSYLYNPNPHGTEDKRVSQMNGHNVVGYLDNGANKTIVVGAHYDHLGLNQHHNSTSPNSEGQIHNGADDNASGVSGLLELARMFSTNRAKEKCNFVFVAFSGEEDGLKGSKAFAENVQTKYPNVVAMINMDMIGRLDSLKALVVGGVGTSPEFTDLANRFKPAGFNITLDSSGIGPTDHTSFYLKDIPVLNFFTGTHKDYHKPSDDLEKIKIKEEMIIVDYIFNLAQHLAGMEKIPFTKTKSATTKAVPAYKVSLGIMPDYTDYGDGLHVEAVMDNRPAQLAGLKDKDIIIKIGDCEIKEVYGYMECLSKFKSGDEVPITFKRDGQIQTSKVKF
ncbi:MAG TPA: M20/M25/M40 family metallo-hydrolase [Saprospiraceae bacterium]|nr:M20/M25/M40 family metallo-hydrolase [Saprospiraceae bacterium]